MIATLFEFLRSELQDFIQQRAGKAGIGVDLCGVVDESGRIALGENRIGLNLVCIEEDRTLKQAAPEFSAGTAEPAARQPVLRINAVAMFAAYFKQYDQALKAISLVLQFLQSHALFRPEVTPRLDARFPRVSLELLTLSYEQLNQIWGFVGGKQLPSVFCRIRTITIQDEAPSYTEPLIRAVVTDLHSR
jgi:hypothetical protein